MPWEEAGRRLEESLTERQAAMDWGNCEPPDHHCGDVMMLIVGSTSSGEWEPEANSFESFPMRQLSQAS